MRPVLKLIASLLCAALGFASTALADREDRLYIELASAGPEPDETHYNWYRADADFWRGAAQGLLEPLFYLDKNDGSLNGWLARKYEIATDGKSATIWLRPDARWSNGNRLTAQDVAFSIALVKEHNALDGPHAKAIRDTVESVEVPNRFQLVIALNESDPDFLKDHFTANSGIAFPIVSRRKWEGIADVVAFDNPSPLGSGPYRLDGLDLATGAIAWSRHNGWWGYRTIWRPLPAPARLFWVPPEDTRERRVRGITGGRLDSAMAVSPGTLDGMHAVASYVDAWPHTLTDEGDFLPYSALYWSGWPGEMVENWPENQQVQFLIHGLKPSSLNGKK